MSVRIDEINVKGLGPIDDEKLPLGLFNIIYGRNEQGKTFLVEFVTKSLFKNTKFWTFRNAAGRGKVSISGLLEQDQPLTMSPGSSPKLEQLLEDQNVGLPSRISRLMVVKGADLSFDDKKQDEIDSTILKEFLSGEVLLDEIQGRISGAIRSATVDNGVISGDGRNRDIRSWTELRNEIDSLDSLVDDIERLYTSGERRQLADEVAAIEEQIAEQKEAKRYAAFLAKQELDDVTSALVGLPQEKLTELDRDHSLLLRSNGETARFEEELVEFEQKSAQYEWLGQAIDWYEKRGLDGEGKPNRLWLFAAGGALVLAILSSILGIPAATVVLILLSALFAILYWRQLEKSADEAFDSAEMTKLEEDFERRIGGPLTSLPQMKALKQGMEEAHAAAARRREDLKRETANRDALQDKITSLYSQLTGESPGQEDWPALLRQLNERHSTLQKLNLDLVSKESELDVPEEEYRMQPASVTYSRTALQELIDKLNTAQSRLDHEEQLLSELKESIRIATGDRYAVDWDALIESLYRCRDDKLHAFRDTSASIIAGHLVSQVLEEHRAREQETISKRLNSQEVTDALLHITDRYNGAVSDGGDVLVVDQYGQFRISELSTGAREQVLLGLRIGFLRQIFKQQSLFLLLDDAFQHADYPRRERLVDLMVKLAQDGWQIIYFTMDDHIRDLFVDAGKEYFPEDYAYHVLKLPADEAVEVR